MRIDAWDLIRVCVCVRVCVCCVCVCVCVCVCDVQNVVAVPTSTSLAHSGFASSNGVDDARSNGTHEKVYEVRHAQRAHEMMVIQSIHTKNM